MNPYYGIPSRSGSNELVFTCSRCGRKKMYVNEMRGVYFCHRCHATGVTTKQDIQYARTPSLRRGSELNLSSYKPVPLGSICNRMLSTVQYIDLYKNQDKLMLKLSSPVLENSKDCGIHVYNPNDDPKYKTYGIRGVTSFTFGNGGGPVLLFEGMFDYLNAVNELLHVKRNTFDASLVFCPGSTIGEEIVFALGLYFGGTTYKNLYLCFDLDKIGPVLSAQHQLEPWFNVNYLLPPRMPNGKDWDDALFEVHELAMHKLLSVVDIDREENLGISSSQEGRNDL